MERRVAHYDGSIILPSAIPAPPERGLIALMGPSSGGKSTLMRAMIRPRECVSVDDCLQVAKQTPHA